MKLTLPLGRPFGFPETPGLKRLWTGGVPPGWRDVDFIFTTPSLGSHGPSRDASRFRRHAPDRLVTLQALLPSVLLTARQSAASR